ncbi:MAG: branched-chain amino acid aminotransferase [Chthoniobacter sp.]|jgi:branched-subunit amino acid aminotransferase/4-amino-4-deoxychorismate lyase|nr:branched-chain amino acid aminotransferase [Chthoniobacter sp.]
MRSWRWNGAAFEPCDSVPLSDRGFRYGMSLFESLRVTRGNAEFFAQHLARLVQACAEREFAVDEAALSRAGALFAGDALSGFARLYVTAGDGPPAVAVEAPRLFVLFEERPPPPPDEAWELTLHDETYAAPFGGLKTANYWFNTDALARARGRGFDEALLFNDRAELVSACMANVFVVRDDRLSTPSRSSGARSGVIREWVINRRKVAERRLRREDIVNADEIFLTNSWIGILPVATLEGRPLGPRSVGPKLAAELETRRAPPEPPTRGTRRRK